MWFGGQGIFRFSSPSARCGGGKAVKILCWGIFFVANGKTAWTRFDGRGVSRKRVNSEIMGFSSGKTTFDYHRCVCPFRRTWGKGVWGKKEKIFFEDGVGSKQKTIPFLNEGCEGKNNYSFFKWRGVGVKTNKQNIFLRGKWVKNFVQVLQVKTKQILLLCFRWTSRPEIIRYLVHPFRVVGSLGVRQHIKHSEGRAGREGGRASYTIFLFIFKGFLHNIFGQKRLKFETVIISWEE